MDVQKLKKTLKKIATGCVIGVATVGLLVGCSNTADTSSKTEKTEAKVTYQKQDANNFLINIESLDVVKSQKNMNKAIFTVSIKNNSPVTQDIGALDFQFKAGSKTYDIDPDANAFGEPVKAGQTIKRDITFALADTVEKGTLMYTPAKKSLANWDVKIEE